MIAHKITEPINKERVKLILMSIDKLSTVPEFLLDLLHTLDKNDVTVAEAAKKINRDQSIVTKVLAIANSPFYGLYRKVASVEQALMVIGFREVKNIVTTLTILETFKNKSDKYLNQKEFWEHSFLVGNLSKKLFSDLGFGNGSEAFIGGFLHDLGISITHKYFHESFINIYNEVFTNNASYSEVEGDLIGMSHQEITMHLIDKWNFPVELCQSVLFHHRPSRMNKDKNLATVIHLADYIVSSLNEDKYFWDFNYVLDSEALEAVGLNSIDEVEQLKDKYKDILEEVLISI